MYDHNNQSDSIIARQADFCIAFLKAVKDHCKTLLHLKNAPVSNIETQLALNSNKCGYKGNRNHHKPWRKKLK